MTTIKKILVPVDFSEGAQPAIALAATLARQFGASVELFHVWQPPALVGMPVVVMSPSLGSQPINMEELARSNAGTQMNELATRLRDQGLGDVHTSVGIGSPAQQIVELAERGQFDLIVMGTHGRGGFAHVLLGSVAEKVVRRAKCPVLTVRQPSLSADRSSASL